MKYCFGDLPTGMRKMGAYIREKWDNCSALNGES